MKYTKEQRLDIGKKIYTRGNTVTHTLRIIDFQTQRI